jgi:aryl-alcohol dehydrogenase-like predicted oxidoreductase
MAAWEFQALQNVAEKHGWHKFISMQNYYNLIYREEEREMLPYCRDTGVGCIPVRAIYYSITRNPSVCFPTYKYQWSPNARGILARPWGSTTDPPSVRSANDTVISRLIDSESGANEAIVKAVEKVAKSRGVPMVVVATAWCLSKKGVNPIVGLNSKQRIDEILEAVKIVLTEEEVAMLEAAYLPKFVIGY